MPFAFDYLVLVFLASCGVIQLAALKGGLRGLYLLKTPILNLAFGLALIVTPFVWFFVSEPRNLSDTAGGLNGNQQAALYVIGSVVGILSTLLITSLRRVNNRYKESSREPGLDALRYSNYSSALRCTFRKLWTR